MNIVIPLFAQYTALDAVGPYEVLSRLPGATTCFAAISEGPVRNSLSSLALVADRALSQIDHADVLVVPGGPGTRAADPVLLDWLRRIHVTTTWTTSVCTGSLLLAQAGILEGLAATSHWYELPNLARWGARPVARRVVEDGKVITCAGVSAGIDMALTLVARIAGPEVAQTIQLAIEYDPEPPFQSGSVDKAPPAIVASLRERLRQQFER